ncbi:hypothetical protein N0V82_010800 [Gnomoniopsis sp. IMI 355080]|nr:hypothetical protein N0V82_010800 [Gnomoniopsis sp. IMI 355080]
MPLYVLSTLTHINAPLPPLIKRNSHLLPKKSYHVYNESNIARVRADEAAAAAAEFAKEQREQAVDAARRLAILRGETPPPLSEAEPDIDPAHTKLVRRDEARSSSTGFAPRKRKHKGEDDTDFELRMARERAEAGARVAGELATGGAGGKRQRVEVDLVGKDGHIDLVGAPPEDEKAGKNAEYEKEAARKKRELEDQYTMRFSNASGRDGFAAGDPWYASSNTRQRALDPATVAAKEDEVGIEAPTKNVWGRDDPKRQGREVQRIASNDPLAMMRTGAKKVREIEKERRRENEERARELKELEREERRKEKRMRRERHEGDGGRHRHRSDRSEHSRRRHRDEDREERRHRHRDHPGRSRERERRKESEGDHERDRERTRTHSKVSI